MSLWWLLLPGAGLVVLYLLMRQSGGAAIHLQAVGGMPSLQTPGDVAANLPGDNGAPGPGIA